MMKEQAFNPYEPELGQWAFGAPPGEFDLGELENLVIQRLRTIAIRTKVQDLGDNIGGVMFQNDVFEIRNYHWCTEMCLEEPSECPIVTLPNFKCGDIEIRWYKRLGRGMSVNRQATKEELIAIFQRCEESLTPI